MQAIARDGTYVTTSGRSTITTSAGETYQMAGSFLTGPGGILSSNCKSINEAFATILGLHGGRRI